MSRSARQAHWEKIYSGKSETEVSWFQASPEPSLTLLARVGATPAAAIIDIGGGAARLVDSLLAQGYADVTVLDLSAAALAAAKTRLGATAARANWIVADATAWRPERAYDLWHDRAAFHFLTEAADQAAYAGVLRRALRPGGHAVIATFAPD
ncbi:MAG TPA: class I SAM-dependent methyltransferase, partial [Candidatus Sulfotelmatobacter sp.]|nr:class I SAM-dependent methyltransferase [Candidatus Sulfotelmatobacter sp.]